MAIKVSKDGLTTKLTGKDLAEHKRKVWESQGRACAGCGMLAPMKQLEFHHFAGRGMNGSKTNDTDPRNSFVCGGPLGCHEKARLDYIRAKHEKTA